MKQDTILNKIKQIRSFIEYQEFESLDIEIENESKINFYFGKIKIETERTSNRLIALKIDGIKIGRNNELFNEIIKLVFPHGHQKVFSKGYREIDKCSENEKIERQKAINGLHNKELNDGPGPLFLNEQGNECSIEEYFNC